MSILSEMANTQRRALITWVVLVAATVASWWLASDHGLGTNSVLIGTVLILTIAFAKIRFIGTEFMELRTAPTALKIIFDLWVVGVWGVLIGLYLLFGA
jgi:hypothetical protein